MKRPEEEAPMRAAIYLRVSTAEQAQSGTSLADQEKRCLERCESEGWTVALIARDEGVSGARWDRPGWVELMGAVEAGEADVVVASALDRLGRTGSELLAAMDRIDAAGAGLDIIASPVDVSSSTGRFSAGVLAVAAQHERDRIRERMISGLRARVEEGKWPGGPAPFGYKTTPAPDGRGAVLEIEPVERDTWRAIHRLIVTEGLSTWEAAEELNREGRQPRRAKRWTGSNLRRIILDARGLAGEWTHRFQGRTWVIDIPAIFTPAEHAALLGALAERRDKYRSRQGAKRASLLAGHLQMPCGGSGQGVPAYRADGTRRPVHWYRCSSSWAQMSSGERCDCRRAHGPDLDEAVWAEVLRVLGDTAARRELAVAARGRRPDADPVAAAEQLIDHLTSRITADAAEMRTAGLSAAAIAAALAPLSAELEEAEGEREKAVADRRRALDRHQAAESLATRIDTIGASLEGADEQLRRQIIDILDVRVRIEGWDECDHCEGKGLVPWTSVPPEDRPDGHPRGLTCPRCHRTRHIVRASITVQAPETVLEAVAAGIPVADLDERRERREPGAGESTEGAETA